MEAGTQCIDYVALLARQELSWQGYIYPNLYFRFHLHLTFYHKTNTMTILQQTKDDGRGTLSNIPVCMAAYMPSSHADFHCFAAFPSSEMCAQPYR